MAGIGGIEWGYCGECCKEVPIIKAAKGAMLEDHQVLLSSGRVSALCEGSLSSPGSAPAGEVERVAFQVPSGQSAEPQHDEASHYARIYGAPHSDDSGCGCPMRGGVHAEQCAAVADEEGPLQRSRDALSRMEANRYVWRQMLDELSEAARIDQDTCAAAGPHRMGTYPDCGNHRRGNCGVLPSRREVRGDRQVRRGPSADLVVVDEMPQCSCEGFDHDERCPASWQAQARETPTDYVAAEVDEEYTFSDAEITRLAQACMDTIGWAARSNRDQFVLHTIAEPAPIEEIIADAPEWQRRFFRNATRVDISDSIASIEMEGPG